MAVVETTVGGGVKMLVLEYNGVTCQLPIQYCRDALMLTKQVTRYGIAARSELASVYQGCCPTSISVSCEWSEERAYFCFVVSADFGSPQYVVLEI
jgi:hypothetical protein